jgi:hypothetical protein
MNTSPRVSHALTGEDYGPSLRELSTVPWLWLLLDNKLVSQISKLDPIAYKAIFSAETGVLACRYSRPWLSFLIDNTTLNEIAKLKRVA